jgi:hypothetical protein
VKLGVIFEPEAYNSYYRAIFPMRALERRGHEVVWPATLQQDVPTKALFGCDLVHCFRRIDRVGDLKTLAAHGVAISFDNDDDLSAIDLSNTSSGRYVAGPRGRLNNRKKFTEILKITRFADLATTPSEVLAEKYREAGAEAVTVIENYIDDRAMPSYGRRLRHDGVVVGWVAGKEHERDLPQLSVTEAIAALLDRHPQLRVVTIGSRLQLNSARYEFRQQVPYEELARATGGFDIGIAPLLDTPFNRARSNVKLKEYSAGGAAWLASAVGPYRAMGTREGGRLVHHDRWLEALDELIRSGFKRRRLSRQALKWAKRETIDANAPVWEDAFEGAIERAQARFQARRAVLAR